jgi:hypothetical protein
MPLYCSYKLGYTLYIPSRWWFPAIFDTVEYGLSGYRDFTSRSLPLTCHQFYLQAPAIEVLLVWALLV